MEFNEYKGHHRDCSKSDYDHSGVGEVDPSLNGGIGIVGSSIDQFNESNFSWRSAAYNVNKVNLRHLNNHILNKNINSLKFSKDHSGFDQIVEN